MPASVSTATTVLSNTRRFAAGPVVAALVSGRSTCQTRDAVIFIDSCPAGSSPSLGRPNHLEAVSERVAVVDEDGVEAGVPRPAGDRGDDARRSRRPCWPPLDPAVEQRADDALVDEVVADLELARGRTIAPCAPRCRCRRASGRWPCRRRTPRCVRSRSALAACRSTGCGCTPLMVAVARGATNV